MARIKRTKNNDPQHTIHRKLKIEEHELTTNRGWTRVLRKGKQFLLHWWYPSCCSFNKPRDCNNEQGNIQASVIPWLIQCIMQYFIIRLEFSIYCRIIFTRVLNCILHIHVQCIKFNLCIYCIVVYNAWLGSIMYCIYIL